MMRGVTCCTRDPNYICTCLFCLKVKIFGVCERSGSYVNDYFTLYVQYFNQILTVVLEVLDDFDSSIRELSLSLIIEMLKNQVLYFLSCMM